MRLWITPYRLAITQDMRLWITPYRSAITIDMRLWIMPNISAIVQLSENALFLTIGAFRLIFHKQKRCSIFTNPVLNNRSICNSNNNQFHFKKGKN